MHRFFCWSPYSSGNIISKFHNFPQLDGLVGSWFNRLVGLACVERCFCDFGAQIVYGSGPYAQARPWEVLWVHFVPWIKLHAAHHESMWILGGEAS